ncbi:MFS transporter [Rhodococcus sp. IEGM 1330]|uniref:MFS transporter n=1 Tax=Rhodococcus sp. IEGM 1330 TaxID=3082225 RepID=UPI002955DDF0|nr:MFS transporter [Rhodococcus sp. IEGM 1330]MDV8022196.1 MFS transporter [Rhodococcus sp. IEGM 1330]
MSELRRRGTRLLLLRLTRNARSRFDVLSNRNFRLFVGGQVTSAVGTWMMIATQDWLILEWTNNSPVALAIATMCQFGPALMIPFGVGYLADRFPKRTLLICVNTASVFVTTIQALSVLSGAADVWHLWVFAACLGVLNSIETPTRMAFVGEIVGDRDFRAASSLSAMYFSAAQLLGPAIAGILIALAGPGTALTINVVTYIATIAGLAAMKPGDITTHHIKPERLDATRGIRRILADPELSRAVALLVGVGLLALNLRTTAPLLARTEFNATPTLFGMVTASIAAGSLCAALMVGGHGTPTLRTALTAAAVLGLAELALGFASNLLIAMTLLVVCGAAMTTFLQSTNHQLQLATNPNDRTHVIAVYAAIVQGVAPMAALALAFLIQFAEIRVVLSGGGAITVCVVGAMYLNYRRARHSLLV